MKTIGDLILKRVQLSPKQNSVGIVGANKRPVFLSFIDYFKKIESLSLALSMIGLKPQQKVMIWAKSSLDWHLMDLSILCNGSITIPVHHDISEEDFAYIWEHSEAEYLVVDDLKKFQQYSRKLKRVPNKIIVLSDASIQSDSEDSYINLNKLTELGIQEVSLNPDTFKSRLKSLSANHVATIVYTSGTTANPKGVIITHKAIMQVLSNLKKFSQKSITYKDRFVSCLPLAHILGRCESFFSLNFGCECVFVSGAQSLVKNIKTLQPSFLILVPLILEHIQQKIISEISHSELQKFLFETAQKTSDSFYSAIDRSENPKHFDILAHQLSMKFIYNNIYKSLGGNLRYIITGGAPLSPDVFHFFRNIKISVLEGYGLTETFAPCTVNPLHKQYAGTAGVPIGDVEIKFGHDNEIMIKTDALFSGYFKDNEATENAFENGWLKTGDIGHFSNKGSLIVTGRKKDLIITKGGKNIVPYKIEQMLNKSDYINFSMVIGDKREFLTALIAIKPLKCIQNCKETTEDFTIQELAQHHEVKKLIKKEIERINKNLAGYEQVRDFKIVPIENKSEFHTLSLKLKRAKLEIQFKELIAAMYH